MPFKREVFPEHRISGSGKENYIYVNEYDPVQGLIVKPVGFLRIEWISVIAACIMRIGLGKMDPFVIGRGYISFLLLSVPERRK